MSDLPTRLRRWTHDVDAVPASDLMDEAAAEIERLRAERRWISVEERLPDRITQGRRAAFRSLCGLTGIPFRTDGIETTSLANNGRGIARGLHRTGCRSPSHRR